MSSNCSIEGIILNEGVVYPLFPVNLVSIKVKKCFQHLRLVIRFPYAKYSGSLFVDKQILIRSSG